MPCCSTNCLYQRSLIQTIGRAARHVEGLALLYADKMTDSMAKAISETKRRREIQNIYNIENGITPRPAGKKANNSILSFLELSRKLNQDGNADDFVDIADRLIDHSSKDSDSVISLDSLPELIGKLESKMKLKAKELDFEKAAILRDRIKTLRNRLVGK